MKVPLSWLRDYVDVDLPPKELAHKLTMAGIEVGEVIAIGDWNECFVAQVVAVRPHPQADRLSLCQVNAGGDDEIEVVCGAPNVAAGQRVCYAKVAIRTAVGSIQDPGSDAERSFDRLWTNGREDNHRSW